MRTGSMSIISGMIVVMLLMCACGLSCLLVGQRRRRSRQDPLECRVTSVLQPQRVSLPQESSRGAFHKETAAAFHKESLQPEGGLGLLPRSSPRPGGVPLSPHQMSPFHDMPPPLSLSSAPLTRKVELLVTKNQMASAAATGGDIMLLAPTGALLLRATVRKVDADLWLEVTMQVQGGSPSAMVRLTNKDAAPKMQFFGPKPATGPEIFGPDGNLYGMLEMNRAGTGRLVSATTGLPVATVDGDVRRLELAVRTKGGVEMATVSSSGSSNVGDVSICVHIGADLALVVSLLLSVLLAAQI